MRKKAYRLLFVRRNDFVTNGYNFSFRLDIAEPSMPSVQIPFKLEFADDDSNSWDSDDDGDENQVALINTSYHVDRMASDGRNVMYTSYFADESDLIAYCLFNDPSGRENAYRDWNQSQIEDMIWWKKIEQFVCATKKGIYTVEYINRQFKITLCSTRHLVTNSSGGKSRSHLLRLPSRTGQHGRQS